MDQVYSVYEPGVIGAIEQFTLGGEELRQFVVYVYYDISEKPLYVGCSKSFYGAHYFNRERLSFFEDVEYVGFVFFNNEEDMKDARKYYIRALNPKHNQRKCENVPLLPDLEEESDWLVVSRRQMEHRWGEWLGTGEGLFDEILDEKIECITTELIRKSCGDGMFVPEWGLDDWESQIGYEVPIDPLEPKRGRETVCHYFANLSPEIMKTAVQYKWAGRQAIQKQLSQLEVKFDERGYYLVRDDFSILEAEMLLAWVEDFENLAKKPRFDLDYVCHIPEND